MARHSVSVLLIGVLAVAAGVGGGVARAELDEAARQEAHRKAQHFIDHEKQFHLGVLPTEQSNPKSAGLAETAKKDLPAAIRMLQAVDADVPPRMARVFQGPQFARLVKAIHRAVNSGHQVCFSGCGATGRLSILLEARWRQFWQDARARQPDVIAKVPDLENRVVSIMTGGDYALIRSVESFEDYAIFGRQQVREAKLGQGDVLVAISEGGETSSVIGTIWQALDNGAEVYFAFNNPADILARHIGRSRQVIEDARVTVLDLSCGPMAVAGSTRMQATTSELLVAGAALEIALCETLQAKLDAADLAKLGATVHGPADYARQFSQLLADLETPASVAALTAMVEREEKVYRRKGLVTYLADQSLLDIFTDTTERSPTFMLPRFRKRGDQVSPPSWAFVKSAQWTTPEAWHAVLRREPRCLTWNAETYRQLDAPAKIRDNPPRLSADEMQQFLIGNEVDASRYGPPENLVVLVALGEEVGRLAVPGDPLRKGFQSLAKPFADRAVLAVGQAVPPRDLAQAVWHVPVRDGVSPLGLWDRLSIKLALNTVSTATMARLGRLASNWMAHVEPTNKKLIDRGTRLVSELAGVDYKTACYALHETIEELNRTVKPGQERPSPVALTIARLRSQKPAATGK